MSPTAYGSCGVRFARRRRVAPNPRTAATLCFMIHPKIDDLTAVVPSKYALVLVASRRARELNDYHRQLGEGEFIAEKQYAPPMVESRSKNYLTMALEEVAADKIAWETTES